MLNHGNGRQILGETLAFEINSEASAIAAILPHHCIARFLLYNAYLADYWQVRLESGKGSVISQDTLVISVFEDWPGGAGNGSLLCFNCVLQFS